MNSGGGKEGGGGRRATPARIPPPKGSERRERVFSRFPRELSCSALTRCVRGLCLPRSLSLSLSLSFSLTRALTRSSRLTLSRPRENRTLQPASANYGDQRPEDTTGVQQGVRRKDSGRNRKLEEGSKGREECTCVCVCV